MSKTMQMSVDARPHLVIDLEERYVYRVVPEGDGLTLTGVVSHFEPLGEIDAEVIQTIVRMAAVNSIAKGKPTGITLDDVEEASRRMVRGDFPSELEKLREETAQRRNTISERDDVNLEGYFNAVEARLRRLEDRQANTCDPKEK